MLLLLVMVRGHGDGRGAVTTCSAQQVRHNLQCNAQATC